MISEQQIEFVRSTGSKFGRALMGLLFFVSGLSMLFISEPAGVAGFFASFGIPGPLLFAWLVIILKIIAGGALILGRYVPEAAGSLIVFTLVATLIAHMDFADPNQLTAALKNLAIVGGLLYVMAFGPGGVNLKASTRKGSETEEAQVTYTKTETVTTKN